jgi:uncharacterized protein (DUF433 family)
MRARGKGMTEQQLLERITLNPKVMAGKPVIRGTRLTVEYILESTAKRVGVACSSFPKWENRL